MAQMLKKSWRAALMVACLAPFIFTSCIKDDLDGCNPLEGIYINFVYDYNVKQADAFDSEVSLMPTEGSSHRRTPLPACLPRSIT